MAKCALLKKAFSENIAFEVINMRKLLIFTGGGVFYKGDLEGV